MPPSSKELVLSPTPPPLPIVRTTPARLYQEITAPVNRTTVFHYVSALSAKPLHISPITSLRSFLPLSASTPPFPQRACTPTLPSTPYRSRASACLHQEITPPVNRTTLVHYVSSLSANPLHNNSYLFQQLPATFFPQLPTTRREHAPTPPPPPPPPPKSAFSHTLFDSPSLVNPFTPVPGTHTTCQQDYTGPLCTISANYLHTNSYHLFPQLSTAKREHAPYPQRKLSPTPPPLLIARTTPVRLYQEITAPVIKTTLSHYVSSLSAKPPYTNSYHLFPQLQTTMREHASYLQRMLSPTPPPLPIARTTPARLYQETTAPVIKTSLSHYVSSLSANPLYTNSCYLFPQLPTTECDHTPFRQRVLSPTPPPLPILYQEITAPVIKTTLSH